MNCVKCDGRGKFIIKQGKNETEIKCSYCIGAVKYAGIGSRETPEAVALEMSNIAMQLALRGFVLRSGGAQGADKAFEKGCDLLRGKKTIRGATHWDKAIAHASMFHPNWQACDERAQALHARNSLIMLGDWLDDPVSFVVCWTPGGAIAGGTGQALRIALACGIPVYNLAVQPAAGLWDWLAPLAKAA